MIGENYRIRDVAEIVKEVVPDCEIAFAAGASPDTRNYRVDFTQDRRSELPGFAADVDGARTASRSCTGAYTSAELTQDEWEGWSTTGCAPSSACRSRASSTRSCA